MILNILTTLLPKLGLGIINKLFPKHKATAMQVAMQPDVKPIIKQAAFKHEERRRMRKFILKIISLVIVITLITLFIVSEFIPAVKQVRDSIWDLLTTWLDQVS